MITQLLKRYATSDNLRIFKKIFNDCLDVTNEKVIIVGDYGTRNNLISPVLTNIYSLAARELKLNYGTYFQNSKIRGEHADDVLVSIFRKLPENSVIIVNVSSRMGTLGSVGLSFRKFCKARNHRFISSSSLGSLDMKFMNRLIDTLDVNYKRMHEKSIKLKEKLDRAREVHVFNRAGTDITYNVEGYTASINDGFYQSSGKGGNMPAGEVYIPPNKKRVNGTIAIDGSARLKDRTLVVTNPIKMTIENGEITKMNSCYEAKLLEATLKWAHKNSKHPWGVRRIGELGIGINEKARIVGATVIDEKTVGTAHFAIGSNAWFGGSIYSIIHLDQVLRNAVIKIDGRLLKV